MVPKRSGELVTPRVGKKAEDAPPVVPGRERHPPFRLWSGVTSDKRAGGGGINRVTASYFVSRYCLTAWRNGT